jgi:hypothetical protein
LSNTSEHRVDGARRAWALLLWLPLVVVLLLSGCAAQSSRPPGQEAREPAEERGSRGELGHPALGDAGAPVVMVEYADYQ